MRKVILEKDYSGEEILYLTENLIDSVHEAKLPLNKHGFFKGTISIKVIYTDYEGEYEC